MVDIEVDKVNGSMIGGFKVLDKVVYIVIIDYWRKMVDLISRVFIMMIVGKVLDYSFGIGVVEVFNKEDSIGNIYWRIGKTVNFCNIFNIMIELVVHRIDVIIN